jgi:hypothetical protein
MRATIGRLLLASGALCAGRTSEAQDTAWRVLVPRTVGALLTGPQAEQRYVDLRSSRVPNGGSPAAPVFDLAPHARVELGIDSIEGPGSGATVMPGVSTQPRTARPIGSPGPWWAPAASAALPGAGQAQLGQDRFVGYLAIEGFLWLRYLTDRREGIRQRNAYRELALDVSRAPYGGPKPTGDFEYYERMEHWIASGVFDTDPVLSGINPETDTTTFNGAMWLLARRTYWTRPDVPPPVGSPAYLAALNFYEQSAVRPAFEWSWRGARLEQDIYRRHIRQSNDAFRRAISDVGIVIANHVLSTVDAYISLRLRFRAQLQPGAPSNVGFSASIPWATLGGPMHAETASSRTR